MGSVHGFRGGLVAGLLFVLPGAMVVFALATTYAALGQLPLIAALFFGIKAAVLAIVFEALLRIARRALRGAQDWLIALVAFGFVLQIILEQRNRIAIGAGFERLLRVTEWIEGR